MRLIDAGRVDECRCEEGGRFFRNALQCHLVIVTIYFESNAVSSPLCGGNSGRASTHKRIENGVTNKTEHANEPFGEFEWIRCGMLFCRGPCDSAPDLLKPFLVVLRRNYT